MFLTCLFYSEFLFSDGTQQRDPGEGLGASGCSDTTKDTLWATSDATSSGVADLKVTTVTEVTSTTTLPSNGSTPHFLSVTHIDTTPTKVLPTDRDSTTTGMTTGITSVADLETADKTTPGKTPEMTSASGHEITDASVGENSEMPLLTDLNVIYATRGATLDISDGLKTIRSAPDIRTELPSSPRHETTNTPAGETTEVTTAVGHKSTDAIPSQTSQQELAAWHETTNTPTGETSEMTSSSEYKATDATSDKTFESEVTSMIDPEATYTTPDVTLEMTSATDYETVQSTLYVKQEMTLRTDRDTKDTTLKLTPAMTSVTGQVTTSLDVTSPTPGNSTEEVVNMTTTSPAPTVCLSNPCQHGGTCMDDVNGYRCQCVRQFTQHYTGSSCETGETLSISNDFISQLTSSS